MARMIRVDHAGDCWGVITDNDANCNCRKPKEPERVWCSRCGELYPKATYEGDGELWQHGGVFMGLGHLCDGEFNPATNMPIVIET
jgi:hypothetical protein